MKLLFPEPLFDISLLSFSTFLYFQEEEITTTLHPTVSIFTTGCDPYFFAELIEKENPTWKHQFNYAFNVWNRSNEMLHNSSQFIKPLQKDYLKTVWLAYSRTEEAMKDNEDIISSTGLSHEELLEIIDIPMASQELISHILFEKFLELYNGQLPEQSKLMKDLKTKSFKETRAKNIDYRELLNYCNTLFASNNIEQLLIKSYFFRIRTLKHFEDILLSNERLTKFLNKLPVEFSSGKEEKKEYYDNLDVIGWEIFRQLTSRYIDNIDPQERAQFIVKLRTKNNEEVITLKNKCLKLAEQYKGETNIEALVKNISQHVRIHTEKEIKDLLSLDDKQLEDVLTAIFSDEKTWLAIGTFIISLVTGGVILTGGSALAAAANMAAKSFKVAAENDKKIQSSDYGLIYRMHNYDK